jgi:hypothetical protein
MASSMDSSFFFFKVDLAMLNATVSTILAPAAERSHLRPAAEFVAIAGHRQQ